MAKAAAGLPLTWNVPEKSETKKRRRIISKEKARDKDKENFAPTNSRRHPIRPNKSKKAPAFPGDTKSSAAARTSRPPQAAAATRPLLQDNDLHPGLLSSAMTPLSASSVALDESKQDPLDHNVHHTFLHHQHHHQHPHHQHLAKPDIERLLKPLPLFGGADTFLSPARSAAAVLDDTSPSAVGFSDSAAISNTTPNATSATATTQGMCTPTGLHQHLGKRKLNHLQHGSHHSALEHLQMGASPASAERSAKRPMLLGQYGGGCGVSGNMFMNNGSSATHNGSSLRLHNSNSNVSAGRSSDHHASNPYPGGWGGLSPLQMHPLDLTAGGGGGGALPEWEDEIFSFNTLPVFAHPGNVVSLAENDRCRPANVLRHL